MDIKTVVVGPLETNCYIVSIDNECIIIDPGDEFKKIKEAVGDKKVVGCLVTHFHQDHIEALEEVLSKYEVDINKSLSDKFEFEIIETPGHTNESRTFYFKKNNTMFTGDFIFKYSIGRTDLGGSDSDMKSSLEMIKSYPDETIIYPGHGPSTNLGDEKKRFSLYY
ncbi:MAG: MBL fold metallo-hydrolase [Bacilli bacterium]|nr:MBL fold metallo-hydrolase [Bacilli bacterium]